MPKEKKEKKKRDFLSAMTICFIVVLIATILTWVIPAGSYQTIQYDEASNALVVSTADYDENLGTGSQRELPATQETLDKLEIKTDIENFTGGNISKPVSIPGTYEKLDAQKQGVLEFLAAPINGIMDAFDIIIFLMMLGGLIGVINRIGSFNSGIIALSKVCKGREQIIIIVIISAISFLGTIEGFCEETIALYPVLIPIFLAAGYDGMSVVAAIYIGSSIGCTFGTANPFAVGIASYTAGISFVSGMGIRIVGLIIGTVISIIYVTKYANKIKKDPTKSLAPGSRESLMKKYANMMENDDSEFTFRSKLTLVLFIVAFGMMIWGVIKRGWWFTEMAELFLVAGVVIGIIGGLNEKQIVSEFINGAADLTGVILVIGIARAVTIILDSGKISGTILYGLSSSVKHLPPILFIIVLLFVFMILGFFISSSSGMAVLSIPIMAPLADVVGIPREIIVSAYLYGLGIITFISPTGTVLPSLEMVDVSYDKWLKFVMPLLGILTVFASIMLIIQLEIM